MARLSVVIPCYRDGPVLGRALDSLAAQTHPPDEVLVVDDCSPEPGPIEAALRGRRGVRHVRNATNLGLAGARNRGLAEAAGEIVAFMDADDEAHPQRLEFQLREVGAATAVACGLQLVAPGAQPALGRFNTAPVRRLQGVGRMAYANRLCGASLMARRAQLLAAGGYDESLRSCEDYDLWLRMLASGAEVREVQLPLYVYHDNPRGLSRRYADIARYELQVVEKLIASGAVGEAGSLRAGTVLATWLLRHALRAEALGNEDLRSGAQAALRERLAPRWPVLALAVRAARACGLHRVAYPGGLA